MSTLYFSLHGGTLFISTSPDPRTYIPVVPGWLKWRVVCLNTWRFDSFWVGSLRTFFQHSGYGVVVLVFRFWRLLRGLVLRSTPALELRLSTGLGDCCWLDSCLHAVFVSRDLCPTAPAVRRHRARLLEDRLRRFCYCLRHDYSRQSSGGFLVCNITTASTTCYYLCSPVLVLTRFP